MADHSLMRLGLWLLYANLSALLLTVCEVCVMALVSWRLPDNRTWVPRAVNALLVHGLTVLWLSSLLLLCRIAGAL